jgi:hypothetical protein
MLINDEAASTLASHFAHSPAWLLRTKYSLIASNLYFQCSPWHHMSRNLTSAHLHISPAARKMSTSTSSLSPPVETCNRIYEYALSPASGLAYRTNETFPEQKSFFDEVPETGAKFNQLKYVNRRL